MDSCFFVQKRMPVASILSADAHLMFHGYGRRPGAAFPLLDYSYGDDLHHPLRLTKNVYIENGITQPNTNWVVSESVMNRISEFERVAFLPVIVVKAFRAEYRLNEDLFAGIEDSERILRKFENNMHLIEGLGAWYEVVVPMYDRFESQFTENLSVKSLSIETRASPLQIGLSTEMFVEYPMFWKRGMFLAEKVFSSIHRHIDDRFFSVKSVKFR